MFPIAYDRYRDELVVGLWVEIDVAKISISRGFEPVSVAIYDHLEASRYANEAKSLTKATISNMSTTFFLKSLTNDNQTNVQTLMDEAGKARLNPLYVTELDFTKAIPNSQIRKSNALVQRVFVGQTSVACVRAANDETSAGFAGLIDGSSIVSKQQPLTVVAQKGLNVSDALKSSGDVNRREMLSALTLGDENQAGAARDILRTKKRYLIGELDFSKRFSVGDFEAGVVKNIASLGLLGYIDSIEASSTISGYSLVKCIKNYSKLRKIVTFRVPRRIFSSSAANLVAVVIRGSKREGTFDLFSQNALGSDGFNLKSLLERGTISPEPANVTLDLQRELLRVSVEQTSCPSCAVNVQLIPVDESGRLVLDKSKIFEESLDIGVESTFEFELDDDYECSLLMHNTKIGQLRSRSAHQIVKHANFKKAVITNRTKGQDPRINVLAYHDPSSQSNKVELSYITGAKSYRVRVGRLTRAFNGTLSAIDKTIYLAKEERGATYEEFDVSPGAKIVLQDAELMHDRVYEYFVDYVGTDIGFDRKDRSFVHYRDEKKFGSAVAKMSVKQAQSSSGVLTFDIDVDYSSTGIEQTLTSLKQSTAGEIQTSNANVQIGNYIDNLLNNREKFSDLYRVNLIMQDLVTGDEYEVGNFPAGKIEMPLEILRVSKTGRKRFVFRLLQRNASTLFNDAFEQVTDPESLKQFRVQIAKFFNPLVTHQSTIPSTSRLQVRLPNDKSSLQVSDDFLSGYTGSTSVIEVAGGDDFVENSFVTSVSVRFVKNGAPIVSWSTSATKDVTGYIVYARFAGIAHPISYVQADGSLTESIVDNVYATTVGPRQYGVALVLNDLTVTAPRYSDVTNLQHVEGQ